MSDYRTMAIRSITNRIGYIATMQALEETCQHELALTLQDVTKGRVVADADLYKLAFYLMLIDTHNE
jgi:hypothetical protein